MPETSHISPRFTPQNLADWSRGHWTRLPAQPLAGIAINSREVPAGSLFVALTGEKHDAHRFVPDAIANGAAAAVVRHEYAFPTSAEVSAAESTQQATQQSARLDTRQSVAESTPCLLRVDDPNRALMDIAAGYRRQLGPRIIGITGSVGKTTVKDMTAGILSATTPTASTEGNKNNAVGLPLSLLSMPPDTQLGVFEAGMNHPGEIAELCQIMRPDIGIVTNVGPAHLEAFGTVDAIADEKAALLRALPADGFAVLDRDHEYFDYLRSQCPCLVLTVSMRGDADFVAREIDPQRGTMLVRERGHADDEAVSIKFVGLHNLINALLAIAVARGLGIAWDEIRSALPRISPPPMRWEITNLRGIDIINDAYNANSTSMVAALQTFAKHPCAGRRFALLGDMLELGAANEQALHETVGRAAVEAGIDCLLLIGDRACSWIRQGALDAGFDAGAIIMCQSPDTATGYLRAHLRSGDALLLKGSRGMALENIPPTLFT